uniref:Uncharacterized protein n=1 Tax=Bionectria ochroleuca TaxID=29856 RepID=A0A8H7NIA8_BIOOC
MLASCPQLDSQSIGNVFMQEGSLANPSPSRLGQLSKIAAVRDSIRRHRRCFFSPALLLCHALSPRLLTHGPSLLCIALHMRCIPRAALSCAYQPFTTATSYAVSG